MQQLIAGVDIGGTHITVCLVDIRHGDLLLPTMTRKTVDPAGNKKAIIEGWCSAIKESFYKAEMPVGKIGIAMPGPFDYKQGICYIKGLHKYEDLYGQNVKELMGIELEIAPDNILMMNDASAFLFGELNCGAAAGFTNVVGITLGTGLGSGAYFNGKLEEGDLWNMRFREGFAEDYVSARGLIGAYKNSTGEKVPDVRTIADRCSADGNASLVFAEFGTNLGHILTERYAQQSPDLIVIGGNIAKAWNSFIPAVNEVFEKNTVHFLLKQALLGEEAALIGGSYLWKDV